MAQLGEVWKISENGYKLYSCCGHTHTAIDAAVEMRSEHGWGARQVLGQVREVRISTYGPGWDIVSEQRPRTPYQAKLSSETSSSRVSVRRSASRRST